MKWFSTKMTLDLLHELANAEVLCLFHNCMWQSWHSEVNVCFLVLNERTCWFGCSLTGLPVLVWSASTFSSASSSLSTSSTDTGTQLWLDSGPSTSLSALEFVLSRPNKTSFPISWVNEPDGCSLTGLTVLDNWVFGVGWICWESLLLPETSESNYFIQLSLKEIFGGSRGDICTFSQIISPDSITNNFRDTISWECVVKDDCVRSCLIELK